MSASPSTQTRGFPEKKPAWVKHVVLGLYHQSGFSHRKLADLFNQRYYATTGVSVQRTWVRELLIRYHYEKLLKEKTLKHRIPLPLPANHTWGMDTTFVQQHIVLGVIDHGSRLLITLKQLNGFNAWTLLGYLFIAFGQFGKPAFIKTDNHPVFKAKKVKLILCWVNVRIRFTQLASPWQNGRIERLFGTLKAYLKNIVFHHPQQVMPSLRDFSYLYNVCRPHQHLNGRTPLQVWLGIDPYARSKNTQPAIAITKEEFKSKMLRR